MRYNITMDEISALSIAQLQEKSQELEKAFLEKHLCDNLEIRVRTFANGHPHHVRQCMMCGRQSGNALGRAQAQTLLHGQAAPAFDTELELVYNKTRHRLVEDLLLVQSTIAMKRDPVGVALAAQESADTARRKLEAAAALDEAIDAFAKVQYWPHLLPTVIERTQTVAERYRPPSRPFERFESEEKLKAWLESWVEEDFELFKEVRGTHLTEQGDVKIDYILQPRQHLLDAGFLKGPVGLEVKYLRQGAGFASKASRFVWQAVSYTDCSFDLPSGPTRLSRVLLFSNISFEQEFALLTGLSHSAYDNAKVKWVALLELANHANVGNLEIYGSRKDRTGWKIKFATGTYFTKYRGECELHNAQLFQKIRIGNF